LVISAYGTELPLEKPLPRRIPKPWRLPHSCHLRLGLSGILWRAFLCALAIGDPIFAHRIDLAFHLALLTEGRTID
jgi:hypothetical protein